MLSNFSTVRIQAIFAAALVALFAIVGLYFGSPPDSSNGETFGSILRAFAREPQTRTILTWILIDVVTGVIAALRVNNFDGSQLARFMFSNVLPYVLGYMLFWYLNYNGLIDLLPAVVVNGIVSIGYATVMTTLSVSILDNIARAQAGTVPPHDVLVNNLTPAEPHA